MLIKKGPVNLRVWYNWSRRRGIFSLGIRGHCLNPIKRGQTMYFGYGYLRNFELELNRFMRLKVYCLILACLVSLSSLAFPSILSEALLGRHMSIIKMNNYIIVYFD